MSYNGSGTFVVNSAGQPVVTGTVISSTAFNALTADLATGLSTAITKDGQTTTTARVPFAQGISSTLVTDATSATTGSIITAGGISTQKALWVGTTSRLVGNVQADGLLGIGMTPSNILDITQTQNAASIASLKNASTGVSGLAYFSSKNSISNMNMAMFSTGYSPSGMVRADGGYLGCNGAGGITINTEYAQPIYFGISSAEAARFDTSGNLLVGKTATGSAGNGCQIFPTGFAGFTLAGSTSATDTLDVYSTAAAAFRFYVDMGGTIHATSATITAISDRTLKTNIRPLDTGLKEIMGLQPRRFDWINGDGENVVGFVAQEVEEVLPELVTSSKYSVDENGDTVTKKAVKTGDMIPTLVKAIQELTARLTALETK